VVRQRIQCRQTDMDATDSVGDESSTWLASVDLGVDLPDFARPLYARYVRALALLCECAPFVDDPDYSELIDELLADACRHYPLTWHRDGDYRQIAIDGAAPD